MTDAFIHIDYAAIVGIISTTVAFVTQYLLCIKARKLLVKLIPSVLLLISTVVFSVLSAIKNGWDGLGYLFFALLSLTLIFVCGLAWVLQLFIHKK